MRRINKIIIHCTATAEGREVTLQDVTAWHRQRGFVTVGYHYLIGLDGQIWEGRDIAQYGSHCLTQNSNSIGVCYVGGLSADGKTTKDTRTPAQKTALKKLISQLKEQYPASTVHGHNEFAAKDCPCFDVKNENY